MSDLLMFLLGCSSGCIAFYAGYRYAINNSAERDAPASYEGELIGARTMLRNLRTDIMVELSKGRECWDGVPDYIQHRVDSICAVLDEGMPK